MLDCVIIGTGAAGISAALTLKANGKSFVLIGNPELSLKISRAEKIPNYPGLSLVTGGEFAAALKRQLKDVEIEITDERVTGVYALKGSFSTLTESGKTFDSRTVILAVGVESVRKIEGESEFLGRGVSYCATCDGFLYKGKTLAVIATSERFEGEVEYLAKLAKKVYFIPLYKNVGFAFQAFENVEKLMRVPTEIKGELKVSGLVFGDQKEPREIPVDGVFFLKESLPPSALVGGLETENGHVAVSRNAETNLRGLFAAGDCTGRPYQYVKAAGEGNVAAHSVIEYLRLAGKNE
ncbi:MAG: FAD-dependent oxidoreductase [Clostridia bacterium]|nr:FAD-dependent oxidoreductase [Clostridia bacterium]